MDFNDKLKEFNLQYDKLMNMFCSTQAGGVKSIKDLYKKGTGIIIGHGSQDNTRFCIIPNNIIIQPVTESGKSAKLASFLRSRDNVADFYDNRSRGTMDFADGYENKYMPGSLMPHITLKFETIFPPSASDSTRTFSLTGIITQSIPSRTELLNPITEQTDEEIKNESMKFNNESIFTNDEIWGKRVKLSTVLKKISEKIAEPGSVIPQAYILTTCRSSESHFITYLQNRLDKYYPEYIPTHDTQDSQDSQDIQEAKDEGGAPVSIQKDEGGASADDESVALPKLILKREAPADDELVALPKLILKREASASIQEGLQNFTTRYTEFITTRLTDDAFLIYILEKYNIDVSHLDKFRGFIKHIFADIDSDVKNYDISVKNFCVFQRLYQGELDAKTARQFLNPRKKCVIS